MPDKMAIDRTETWIRRNKLHMRRKTNMIRWKIEKTMTHTKSQSESKEVVVMIMLEEDVVPSIRNKLPTTPEVF